MRHDERGSALLIAMLMMLALAVLGATFLSVSLTDRKIASSEADANKAFAVSEAGIEDARAALATTTINTLLAAGGHLFTGSTVGGGTYVVDVKNNCCGNLPASTIVPTDAGGQNVDTVLNATGTLRKASRRIQTVVRIPQSFFEYGIWCNAGATMSGASFIDSYNSTAGAYGGGNVGSNAGVFCNGGFNMSATAQVRGNCSVGDASCTGGGGVTGTRTINTPVQTRAAVACPVMSYPASVAGTGVTYNATTGALVVNGSGMSAQLTAPPTVYYFSSVKLQGGGSLTVNTGGQHIDIYVAGQLDTSGGGVLNTSANPTQLSFFACGALTTDWKLSGGSGAYFAAYAPTRDITISGGGSSLFGALVGNSVTNSGGAQIHYDQALATGSIPSVVARTWREIFP